MNNKINNSTLFTTDKASMIITSEAPGSHDLWVKTSNEI